MDYHFQSVHMFEESILNNRYTPQFTGSASFYRLFIPSVHFPKVYRIRATRWTLLRNQRGLCTQGDSGGQGVPPGRAPECK